MDRRLWLVGLGLVLGSCARRLPPPPAPQPAKPEERRETPKSRPLRVESPPGRTPSWTSPGLEPAPTTLPESHPFLEKPGLDLPLMPRTPSWTGRAWDRRFDDWHFADLKKQSLPKLDWKLDLEIRRVVQKDVFKKFDVPVNNIESVLEQIEREQQERNDGYPNIPNPFRIQVPY